MQNCFSLSSWKNETDRNNNWIQNYATQIIHWWTSSIFIQSPPLTNIVKVTWNRILSLPCGPRIPAHSGFGVASGDRAASSKLKDVNCWIKRIRKNDASLYANCINWLILNPSWAVYGSCAHLLAYAYSGSGVEGAEDERIGNHVLLNTLIKKPIRVKLERWNNEGQSSFPISMQPKYLTIWSP